MVPSTNLMILRKKLVEFILKLGEGMKILQKKSRGLVTILFDHPYTKKY